MITLEINQSGEKEYLFFDNVEDKDIWLDAKYRESKLKENPTPEITVIKEHDSSVWLKDRKPNVNQVKAEVEKKENIQSLKERQLELEQELSLIQSQLDKLHNPDSLGQNTQYVNQNQSNLFNLEVNEKKEEKGLEEIN